MKHPLILSNLSTEFVEWFRGFTDAEGCFLVVKTGNSFAFRFIIKIHKDDINVLYYIKNSLGGIGNVGVEGFLVHLKVTSILDIKTIIEIFSSYPLNSSKYLDFLAFRRAYELYTSSRREVASRRDEVFQEISRIKESMNSKRTDYKVPTAQEELSPKGELAPQHKILITDN